MIRDYTDYSKYGERPDNKDISPKEVKMSNATYQKLMCGLTIAMILLGIGALIYKYF